MKITQAIWDEAPKNTLAVYLHLAGLAKRMRTETYGEIAEAIGLDEGRKIAPVSLCHPLGFIRDKICRPRGIPWLNSLAVNAGTKRPGESYLPGRPFTKQDEPRWRTTVLSVYGYTHWPIIEKV